MIHVLDHKTDKILAYFKGEVTEGIHEENLDYVDILDVVVNVNEKSDFIANRNRVIINGDDDTYKEFIIDEVETIHEEKMFRCSASYLDLDKQKVIEPITLNGYTLIQAGNFVLLGTEWELGTVEFAGAFTIKFEKHTRAFQALKQLCTKFNVEMIFRIVIFGNIIVGRYVDFVKKRGMDRGKEIVFGKDLEEVRRIENTDNLATALVCLGPTKEDGSRTSVIVENTSARDRWSRNSQHIWDIYEPETQESDLTVARLKTLGTTELNKRINSSVQYSTTQTALEHIGGAAHEKVLLGDTERIKDEEFSPPLYIEARAYSVKRNLVDPSQKEFILGDFIEYTEDEVKKRFKDLLLDYGLKIHRSETPPEGSFDLIWVDTSVIPNVSHTWNGEEWIKATPTQAGEVGAVTPEEAQKKADKAEQEAKDYINNQLVNYVGKATYAQDISIIQDQIDKNITSWFYPHEPRLNNIPASEWTTDEIKNTHLGDLFYDTTTGRAYRFQLLNNVYSWQLLQDNDITAALQNALEAKDIADSKRRVFVDTPVPPYDEGDLWTNGNAVYRASKDKPEGGAFEASDWIKVGDVTSQNKSGDTSKVDGKPASEIVDGIDNFNGRNDRIPTLPALPTIPTDGTAVDHTLNTDGSANISFEWSWLATGESGDIDGFAVYVRASTSNKPYDFGTSPSEESVYITKPEQRAMIFNGVPANMWYTFGVHGFRNVDQDIDRSGLLKGPIAKARATGENPYRPTENVAFEGLITGTVPSENLTGVINPSKTNIKDPVSKVSWGSDGITVQDSTGKQSTSISKEGVNIRNGAFTLEDDISRQKYSIVRVSNLARDHSFEFVMGDKSTFNATNHYMDYQNQWNSQVFLRNPYTHWGTSGTPKLCMDYASENFNIAIFGRKSMLVRSGDVVRQVLVGMKAGQTYTLSAFCRKHDKLTGGIPRFYVRWYDDVNKKNLWTDSKSFSVVPSNGSTVREAFTFTLPSNYTDGQGMHFEFSLEGGNANWVMVDGVQLVESSLPVIYDPEDSYYNSKNGRVLESDFTDLPALWSGVTFFHKGVKIYPDKPISHCRTGWVLVWSDYDDGDPGKANNFNFDFSYVHKSYALAYPNTGFENLLTATDANVGSKYLYINDTFIEGHEKNNKSANHMRDIVLREIYEF